MSVAGSAETFKLIQGFANRHEWGRVGACTRFAAKQSSCTHRYIQLLSLVSPLDTVKDSLHNSIGDEGLIVSGIFKLWRTSPLFCGREPPPDDSKGVRLDAQKP